MVWACLYILASNGFNGFIPLINGFYPLLSFLYQNNSLIPLFLGDSDADVKIVSEFIKFMMTKWSNNLNERTDGEKSSVMGKRETTIHAQTR